MMTPGRPFVKRRDLQVGRGRRRLIRSSGPPVVRRSYNLSNQHPRLRDIERLRKEQRVMPR